MQDQHSEPLRDGSIRIHDEVGFAGMRKAGKLAAQALEAVGKLVRPGITTQALDDFVLNFSKAHNAYPATLMYRGYEKSCCTSINHVVCHGIPGDRVLKEGDIINIDITLIVDGWHGDTSATYAVGHISRMAERLIEVTQRSLALGIEAVKPGAHTGDIGEVIQVFAEGEGFSVVEDFCGHGIGRLFHDAPNILHFGQKGHGDMLKPGMIFTIEPMINVGKPAVKVLKHDGWTAVTRDRSLSAQFEHTVGVTEGGVEIFTRLD